MGGFVLSKTYVAVDIGGSSIKMTAAQLQNDIIITLKEQTFPYEPLSLHGHLHINIYELYQTILTALKSFQQQGLMPASFGIDTFGNGYGILDSNGAIMGLPFFYKDTRTKGILPILNRHLPLAHLYEMTGVYPTDIRVLMRLQINLKELPKSKKNMKKDI
ncbi:hypothetical protein FACS18947_5550 [Bacteroidia bacterium]|nr:hypothetical protein FACS18947_5550 [Bacteroidia bacterium]